MVCPVTPQSDALTTRPLRPGYALPDDAVSIIQSVMHFQSGPSNKITSGSTGRGEEFTGD